MSILKENIKQRLLNFWLKLQHTTEVKDEEFKSGSQNCFSRIYGYRYTVDIKYIDSGKVPLKTSEVTEQLELACIATCLLSIYLVTFWVTIYTEVCFNACFFIPFKYINSINNYILQRLCKKHKIAFQVILHEVFVKSYIAHVKRKPHTDVKSPQINPYILGSFKKCVGGAPLCRGGTATPLVSLQNHSLKNLLEPIVDCSFNAFTIEQSVSICSALCNGITMLGHWEKASLYDKEVTTWK